jgi:hypothetical protein
MEKEELYDIALLGKLMDEFTRSDVGSYMIRRANLDIEDAYEELKKVDPHDFSSVQKAQNKVYRAESIKDWMKQAIQAGTNAKDILEQRSEENEF